MLNGRWSETNCDCACNLCPSRDYGAPSRTLTPVMAEGSALYRQHAESFLAIAKRRHRQLWIPTASATSRASVSKPTGVVAPAWFANRHPASRCGWLAASCSRSPGQVGAGPIDEAAVELLPRASGEELYLTLHALFDRHLHQSSVGVSVHVLIMVVKLCQDS